MYAIRSYYDGPIKSCEPAPVNSPKPPLRFRDLGIVDFQDTWQGKPVWVVGAPEGDNTTPQFWIEKERLLLVRTVRRSVVGFLIDVDRITSYNVCYTKLLRWPWRFQ